MELFPGHPELQWPLQDLYDDYLDYCILVVRYLKNRPSRKWETLVYCHFCLLVLIKSSQYSAVPVVDFPAVGTTDDQSEDPTTYQRV